MGWVGHAGETGRAGRALPHTYAVGELEAYEGATTREDRAVRVEAGLRVEGGRVSVASTIYMLSIYVSMY